MHPVSFSFRQMVMAGSLGLVIAVYPQASAEITSAAVIQEMKRTADSQLADSTEASFHLGLLNLHEVSGEAKYREAVEAAGKKAGFGAGSNFRQASDLDSLLVWLELSGMDHDLAKIRPAIAGFDRIQGEPSEAKPKSISGGQFTWFTSDSLFMAPAVWARLSAITGNPKFLDWADREWWTTVDVLYSPNDGLFYQDNGNFKSKTPAGGKTFLSATNGAAFAGIAHMLESLPEPHVSREKYLALYGAMARSLLKHQHADGLWRDHLVDSGGSPGIPAGNALILYGLAWGLNRGLLPADEFREPMTKGYEALVKTYEPSAVPDGETTGAFLLASAEIVRHVDPTKRRANGMDFSNTKLPGTYLHGQPRTRARHVPERADDFAWENDLVAFRTYGPALRPGPENSGIDCWFKRVPYPVMDKWYIEDVTKLPPGDVAKSYHEDHGEGYDAYKVGDSRGCGGISVWADGKLHNSDTYVSYDMIENTPERVIFDLHYASDFKGQVLRETKRITLIMGQRFFQSDSRFTLDGKPAANLEVAIGLMPQSKDAKPVFDPAAGTMSIWEPFDGHGLGTAVAIDPSRVAEMKTYVDGAGQTQALCLAKTDDTGTIRWFSGFAWEGQGTITSGDQWEKHLREFAGQFVPKPYADFSGETSLRVHNLPVPGN